MSYHNKTIQYKKKYELTVVCVEKYEKWKTYIKKDMIKNTIYLNNNKQIYDNFYFSVNSEFGGKNTIFFLDNCNSYKGLSVEKIDYIKMIKKMNLNTLIMIKESQYEALKQEDFIEAYIELADYNLLDQIYNLDALDNENFETYLLFKRKNDVRFQTYIQKVFDCFFEWTTNKSNSYLLNDKSSENQVLKKRKTEVKKLVLKDGKKIKIDPNGECQFSAISHALGQTFKEQIPLYDKNGNEKKRAIPKYNDGAMVRRAVVQYMKQRKKKYEDIYNDKFKDDFPECKKFNILGKTNCNYEEFLSIMEEKETYGNHLTLQAAADMLCIDIRIKQENGEYVIENNPDEGQKCFLKNFLLNNPNQEIIIFYNGVNHYDSFEYTGVKRK